ncbi:sialic acid-binding Ig-like lectin 14 [Centropristis striata]|uniref:sialic acid-binding Ig-like lectin 14 n=1 Tax=Centropristis striata TaxID=184440 RepID=UPI0027DFA903|nr:sialic acid-binding Ig-like lectin 14 [Centropristis striata]
MDKDKKMMVFYLFLAALSSPVVTEEWKASVIKELEALVTSCVVVPCSFSHPGGPLPTSRLRGIWHLKTGRNQLVYYEDQTRILENFRGRTKLLGHLGLSNCTLEITKVRDHDNGPFCFRIELAKSTDPSTSNKFSFVEDCVDLRMLPEPPKPTLSHSETATEGRPFTITCSVTHTCPSHAPRLKWSRADPDAVHEVHKKSRFGFWEAESILTITAEEKDDHTDITCTAEFNGDSKSSALMTLYVKRSANYNHIIIATVVAIGTAVIFAGFCIFMVKRYKKRMSRPSRR